MGSTNCDEAFREVYRILRPCIEQDTDVHFPVSRELHNESCLTILVIAENIRNNERLHALGGCSPGGDVWHFGPIDSPDGVYGV